MAAPALARAILFVVLFSVLRPLPAAPGETSGAAHADYNFDNLVTDVFWRELYPGGGWTLYCGFHFDANRRTPDGRVVSVSHIYPTSWMLKFLGCSSRLECHRKHASRFDRMEADLHNLYPVWEDLDVYRNGAAFGIVPGEYHRIAGCDIEWRNGILEPRPIARGNIARAMLYMHSTYDLPLPAGELELMKKWNQDDPPSEQEKARNGAIEHIQGHRNPYIDQPALVDKL